MTFGKAFEEYASGRTNAPAVFHRFAALSVCAAALGNRVYLDAGWGRIYPSMWVCFVGRSGVRKSTAVNLASSLLAKADASLVLPHDFTREAFYDIVAARPFGLLHWRELGSVLKSLGREYNAGLLPTLVDFWDSPSLIKRRTKGSGEIQICYPAVSILAAAKVRWFVESVTREDIEGGFLGRWLFVSAQENNGAGHFFGMPRTEAEWHQYGSLITHLEALTQYEAELVPGEGGVVLEEWLRGWEARDWNEDKDPADFAPRAGTHIVKLAIALQATYGPSHLMELEREAIEKAIAMWEYAFECGQQLVGVMNNNSRSADERGRVLSFIRSQGVATRRDIYRKFGMTPRDLDGLLESLTEAELISADRQERDGPGKRTVLYRSLIP